MNYAGTVQEIKTNLVSYRLFNRSMLILYFSGLLSIASWLVGDPDSRGHRNRKIENHIIFSHLKENKFVVNNYELLRRIGYGLCVISVIVMLFSVSYAHGCSNLGFFKLNRLRVNVNGEIFPLQKIQSLRFTINSPRVFGDRSEKQGFQNWIEFKDNGKQHRYEFFLKNTVMEDELLLLLEEIKNTYGSVDIKVIETKKSWFLKLQEELGIEPQ